MVTAQGRQDPQETQGVQTEDDRRAGNGKQKAAQGRADDA